MRIQLGKSPKTGWYFIYYIVTWALEKYKPLGSPGITWSAQGMAGAKADLRSTAHQLSNCRCAGKLGAGEATGEATGQLQH